MEDHLFIWIGQKVRSGFSIISYGKTERRFLANAVLTHGTHFTAAPLTGKDASSGT